MQAFVCQFYKFLPLKQHNFPPKLKKICLKLRISPKLKNPTNLFVGWQKTVKKACYIRFCLFHVKRITERCWFNVVYIRAV